MWQVCNCISGIRQTAVHASSAVSLGLTCVCNLQTMDVTKFWDLMINALKAANEVSPLNKQ